MKKEESKKHESKESAAKEKTEERLYKQDQMKKSTPAPKKRH